MCMRLGNPTSGLSIRLIIYVLSTMGITGFVHAGAVSILVPCVMVKCFWK